MYFETVTFKQWIIWKKYLKVLCGSRNLKLTLSFPTVGGILSFPKLCFRSSWGLRTDLASKIRKKRIGILQHVPYPLSLCLLLHWAASPCVPFSIFVFDLHFVTLPLSCLVHPDLSFGFTGAIPEKPADTSVFLPGNVSSSTAYTSFFISIRGSLFNQFGVLLLFWSLQSQFICYIRRKWVNDCLCSIFITKVLF